MDIKPSAASFSPFFAVIIAAVCAVVMVTAGCGKKSTADKSVQGEEKMTDGSSGGLNIFTEILQFPDPDAEKRSSGNNDSGSDEGEKFAETFSKIYEKKVASMGGSPPLEGPEKVRFEKEIMLIQAGLIFDMRLGEKHAARSEFLNTVAWMYDRRVPLIEERQKLMDKGPLHHGKAEAVYIEKNRKLLEEMRPKLKKLFSVKDFSILTGGK